MEQDGRERQTAIGRKNMMLAVIQDIVRMLRWR